MRRGREVGVPGTPSSTPPLGTLCWSAKSVDSAIEGHPPHTHTFFPSIPGLWCSGRLWACLDNHLMRHDTHATNQPPSPSPLALCIA